MEIHEVKVSELVPLLFVSVAFAFVLPWEVMATMIISQSIIGCVYETIAYPIITRHVINWAKSL